MKFIVSMDGELLPTCTTGLLQTVLTKPMRFGHCRSGFEHIDPEHALSMLMSKHSGRY